MLVALYACESENKRIEYTDYQELAKQDRNIKQKLRDPIFPDVSVFPRIPHIRGRGIKVEGHFVSRSKKEFPSNVIWDPEYFQGDRKQATRRESREHIAGKVFIRDCLKKYHANEYYQAKFEFEFLIKIEAGENQGKYRIADLVAIFPSGYIIVHEIQLAKITSDELQQRTDDYFDSGCDVVWWLGKQANTTYNKEWALNHHSGNAFFLEYSQEETYEEMFNGEKGFF